MARVAATQSAVDDEAAILADLGDTAGYRLAAKYKALFDRLYGLLAAHPAIGSRRPSLGPRVRIWVVAPYVVIYELSEREDTVMVLRIVHGRRDITRTLLGSDP
ncbi:MAG: type II toxin-antitoxin system RelE/ParE family toxin [Acetobacteraceae bacterium]